MMPPSKLNYLYVGLSMLPLFFLSCASLRDSPKYQLSNGYYDFRQSDSDFKRVYVKAKEDTLTIYPTNGGDTLVIKPSKDEFFRTRTFDADIMTIGFKFRPAVASLPRQVNTNFNGNVYLGYRVDRFQVHYQETPGGLKRSNHHRALTVGVFGGLGATAVNPWTTNYQITDEYDGLIFSRGLATMIGLNSLTVGVALGWDYLTDRDKSVWVYQNKPWLGLAIGLNIN